MPNTSTAIGPLLENTIGQLFTSLHGMVGTFVGVGMAFLSIAVVLTVLVGMYSWWTSGSVQDLVDNGVRMILIVAPLLVLFSDWGNYMSSLQDFFYRELPQYLNISGGSPEAIAGNAIKQITDAVQMPSNNGGGGFWNAITHSTQMIFSLVIWVLVFILNILLAFAVLFAVFMPVAGLYIGGIFGPIILAWLPWKPLSSMSAKWLGFMISNGITFVVALVILKALTVTVGAMTGVFQSMASDGVMSGVAGYSVTLLALLAVYVFGINLLLQANNIAQGMTGGATVGEGLFGKLAAVGAAAGMGATARLGGGAHAAAAMGAGKVAAKAPGIMGKMASAMGRDAQGKGVGMAISGTKGSRGAAAAGNALRSVGAGLGKVQGGINKAGSVMGSAAATAKDSSIYKKLDKPV